MSGDFPPAFRALLLMLSLLAQVALPSLTMEMVVSLFSASVTGYFWLIRSRQERPNLKFFQTRGYRATLRGGDDEKKTRRLCLTQIEPGGVLVANDSLRQNSIIRFECYLWFEGGWLKGDWGYLNDDKPPWNIGPQSALAIGPASFFDVPQDYQPPEDLRFRIEFVTASGKRFKHHFRLQAPEE